MSTPDSGSALDSALAELRSDRSFMRNVAHWEVVPARAGDVAPFPADLDDGLRRTLRARGIERLYGHQADAYRHVRAGDNVVLVTPTASGKTLAYNLPILTHFLRDACATALYLFPTKALSQDQQAELDGVVQGGGLPVPAFTYDGDTPASVRGRVRDQGRIVITNPDMLHTGVLPHHTKWGHFFGGLRFVVIDELHIYRGVFGSHLANVIRRLKRIAAFYGARPRFVCCSATIGNPLELARRIIEEDAVLIDRNGAPAGRRHFLLYNPPLLDAEQGIRHSVVNEAHEIATRLLRRRVKTIVFARSRTRTELISTYIRESLGDRTAPDATHAVASYRGGYLPSERRRIERGLRDGSLRGVVSTNALELGIDIGGLDASVMAGFPGTISSCRQQAGRSGRTADVSLSILIATPAPIDQFVIRHPEYLFGASPESGHVDPDNIHILLDQLKCAVFELPYRDADAGTPHVAELLRYLGEQGVLHHAGGSWYWTDRAYPAEQVSLRTSTAQNVVIVDATGGGRRLIGEMDQVSAKMLLHDGAIYLHGGEQYRVERLDLEEQTCTVARVAVDYFTESVVRTDIRLLHRDDDTGSARGLVLGDILVRTQPTGFRKIRYHTHERVGRGDIHLPADEMHTRAVAVVLDADTAAGRRFASLADWQRRTVMSRLGHLLRNVAPVFLLCDVRDLGVAERTRDPDLGAPALYLYDAYPGGSGLAEGFRDDAERILRGCRDLVAGCACECGCPSCIGPFESRGSHDPKELMVDFLDTWLDDDTDEGAMSTPQPVAVGIGR
ncbi:MAG: DEAD/DEAH box helicase [Spirochaetaceae bacterium]|nr:DEAD/DEAH box helicase [Spirochaetaceae bacterium]